MRSSARSARTARRDFGVVPRAHPKLEVHLRKGYREVSADADWIYVVLDVAQARAVGA